MFEFVLEGKIVFLHIFCKIPARKYLGFLLDERLFSSYKFTRRKKYSNLDYFSGV